MRLTIVACVLVAFASAATAQPERYTSEEGKFSAGFPDTPKVSSHKTESAVGGLTVHVATYATADGSTFMVSYTDFPDPAVKPENHATLLDGFRDAVKGRDGKVDEEKDMKFGPAKLPGREFTVKKDKAKKWFRFRIVIHNNRVYQVAAIGSPDFAKGKDATAFLDSFELTK